MGVATDYTTYAPIKLLMATPNGLEPSTSSVTGWRSALLNYEAVYKSRGAVAHPTVNWLQMSESNRRLEAYEACDLTVCPICSMVGRAGIGPTYLDFQSSTHPSMSSSRVVLLAGFEPTMQG